jgi:hypothetical protein
MTTLPEPAAKTVFQVCCVFELNLRDQDFPRCDRSFYSIPTFLNLARSETLELITLDRSHTPW